MSESPSPGIFAIDLGTTYSVVGYIDETGRVEVTRNVQGTDTTPSVVYFEGRSNVIVGEVAKEAASDHPDRVVSLIKREIGNREYHRTFFGADHTPLSMSAIILEALAREAEQDTGQKITDVVITVPAYFGLLEKDATRKAGEIAGLSVIELVLEPVAAALYYGVTGGADDTTVLVYDLGGATFDVSLIKMTNNSAEVLAVGGDQCLGGRDWDEKLLEHLIEQTIVQCGDESLRDDEPMLQDMRLRAEEMKKALSSVEKKTQIVRYTGTPAKIVVSREQLEEMTADLLDETIRITKHTLANAEAKYPGIKERISEVLLVGGSTKMPAVTAALRKEFGWDPRLTDPDLAVAKGAAIYMAAPLARWAKPVARRAEPAMAFASHQFDEPRYVQEFLKKLRGARSLPDDVLARYAITLPATNAEIAAQVRAVRAYWSMASSGGTPVAQAARMCRAEDERLRARYGASMDTRAWWEARAADYRSAAQASIIKLAEELRQSHGQLGVVAQGTVGGFATQFGLTPADALQAVQRAGLTLVEGVSLPESPPFAGFPALVKYMAECAVPSVPELVHPGAGPFSLLDRYSCTGDPAKRLDAVAVETQNAEADKRAPSPTESSRRAALKLLRRAIKERIDLRDVALYHLVTVASEYVLLSMNMAAAQLQKAGLERRDAAVIAAVLHDQGTASGAAGLGDVRSLLVSGLLNEASQAALSLPANSPQRQEAAKDVESARERLEALLAEARLAVAVPDEFRAAGLLRQAAAISAEDAEEMLGIVPLPPPIGLRAVPEANTVRLFWQRSPGNYGDAAYVVTRTEMRPPVAADDGTAVYRGPANVCTDEHPPVAREVHYGVFALVNGRPDSRPATVAVTLLSSASHLEDDEPRDLLFRFYVPSGRLYASEAERLLSLFRDWLGRVRGHGVRQAGYQTSAGRVYEFFADQATVDINLRQEFSDFTGFLTLCAEDPSRATGQLLQAGVSSTVGSDLVTRYCREARRLSVDLRHEREQRILAIRHNFESELLDQVDLHVPASQINSLIEALVPDPSAATPLALLGSGGPSNAVPITFNVNQQIINAVESTVNQSVQGTTNLGVEAKELLNLISRFGGEQAVVLTSAVHELEDPDARPVDRIRSKQRLKEFLNRLGESVQDIAVSLLEKYLEAKAGI